MFLEGICIESVKSTYITIQHFYESNKNYISPIFLDRQKGKIMSKKENVVKVLEATTKAADNVANELAIEILVVSAIGLVSSLGAAILKKGGEKKES